MGEGKEEEELSDMIKYCRYSKIIAANHNCTIITTYCISRRDYIYWRSPVL